MSLLDLYFGGKYYCDVKLPKDVLEFFRKQGKIGAAKRNSNLSPERRREIARQAIAMRWDKADQQKPKKRKSPQRRRSQ